MKKLLFAGAMLASFAAIQSASAADLALKAPPPPPAPVYSWTGWYVGVNLGGSFGKAADTSTYGAGPTPFSSTSSRLDGVIGGGQIGYNWQVNSNWLLGLEADIQGSSERGTATSTAGVAGFCGVIALFPCTTAGTLVDQEKLPWFGTVRGRIGVLASPTWLFYATGGLAYGEIKSSETLTAAAGGPFAGGAFAKASTPPGRLDRWRRRRRRHKRQLDGKARISLYGLRYDQQHFRGSGSVHPDQSEHARNRQRCAGRRELPLPLNEKLSAKTRAAPRAALFIDGREGPYPTSVECRRRSSDWPRSCRAISLFSAAR